jgi:exodeoxyribonuclease V gamma subunit
MEWKRAAARAQGLLPHGTMGNVAFERVAAEADGIDVAARELVTPSERTPVDVALAVAGVRISGRVFVSPDYCILRQRFGRVRPVDQLAAWISHLLLCSSRDAEPRPRTWVLGTGERGTAVVSFSAPPDPSANLAALVDLFVRGESAPLPFFPMSSMAYAEAVAQGKDAAKARAKAEQAWYSTGYYSGEDLDPDFAQCFGGVLPDDGSFAKTAQEVLEPMLACREGNAR